MDWKLCSVALRRLGAISLEIDFKASLGSDRKIGQSIRGERKNAWEINLHDFISRLQTTWAISLEFQFKANDWLNKEICFDLRSDRRLITHKSMKKYPIEIVGTVPTTAKDWNPWLIAKVLSRGLNSIGIKVWILFLIFFTCCPNRWKPFLWTILARYFPPNCLELALSQLFEHLS